MIRPFRYRLHDYMEKHVGRMRGEQDYQERNLDKVSYWGLIYDIVWLLSMIPFTFVFRRPKDWEYKEE